MAEPAHPTYDGDVVPLLGRPGLRNFNRRIAGVDQAPATGLRPDRVTVTWAMTNTSGQSLGVTTTLLPILGEFTVLVGGRPLGPADDPDSAAKIDGGQLAAVFACLLSLRAAIDMEAHKAFVKAHPGVQATHFNSVIHGQGQQLIAFDDRAGIRVASRQPKGTDAAGQRIYTIAGLLEGVDFGNRDHETKPISVLVVEAASLDEFLDVIGSALHFVDLTAIGNANPHLREAINLASFR